MKVRTNSTSILWTLIGCLLLGSCKKYLEIQPEDKFTDDQVYSNERTIMQVLNGLYIDFADNNLYGANLSNKTIEIIGYKYNVNWSDYGTNYVDIQDGYYSQGAENSTFDLIWKKAYSTILATNVFLENMDKLSGKSVLSESKIALLKGEVIGLRAMMHFDLLRIYGPVYSVGDSTHPAIPYSTGTTVALQPLLPANEIINKILADLVTAENLLQNDPVTTAGVTADQDINFYSSLRNRRMNYYAVKALQARVRLYRGDVQGAHEAAKAVLDQGEQWFPWTDFGAIIGDPSNPDRVFSSEILFGFYNPNMYSNQASWFSPGLPPSTILTAHPDRLDMIFEANQNDYRYTTTWLIGPGNVRTFYKFADVSQDKSWRFFQPLIRKSEMYYILAETDPDPAQALLYLNTVRFNRGLPDLPEGSDLEAEISKEYQREFWGEGQMFYYYKRKNVQQIANPTDGYDWDFIYSPVYVVPLPVSETKLR